MITYPTCQKEIDKESRSSEMITIFIEMKTVRCCSNFEKKHIKQAYVIFLQKFDYFCFSGKEKQIYFQY